MDITRFLVVGLWKSFTVLCAVAAAFAQTDFYARHHPYKVVCYAASWAANRPGNGQFNANHVDPLLCSHLVYSFAGLNNSTNMLKSLDPSFDIDKDGYKNMVRLKARNPDLKVILAVGGWNEGSERYSNMAQSAGGRQAFINSAVEMLERYGFDGLDLDWEYPTQRGGKPVDADNLVTLLKEMRSQFHQKRWSLSIAVGSAKYLIDTAYTKASEMAKHVDYIGVMSYDYHGQWENFTGLNAPLHAAKNGDDAMTNVEYSVREYLRLGVPPEKLVLGLPFYGRSYTLDDPENWSVGAPSHRPGRAGPYTQSPSTMGYNEICEELKRSSGWEKIMDSERLVPYAHKGSDWISYDDTDSLTLKVKFATDLKLAGVMIWAIDQDDSRGVCHPTGEFPLLKAVNKALTDNQPISPNVVPRANPVTDSDTSDTSESHSVHNALKIWMIVTVWVVHVLRQKLDDVDA